MFFRVICRTKNYSNYFKDFVGKTVWSNKKWRWWVRKNQNNLCWRMLPKFCDSFAMLIITSYFRLLDVLYSAWRDINFRRHRPMRDIQRRAPMLWKQLDVPLVLRKWPGIFANFILAAVLVLEGQYSHADEYKRFSITQNFVFLATWGYFHEKLAARIKNVEIKLFCLFLVSVLFCFCFFTSLKDKNIWDIVYVGQTCIFELFWVPFQSHH